MFTRYSTPYPGLFSSLQLLGNIHKNILPQSFGDFDPEAHQELKTPPNQSETSIRKNFRKLCISIRTKIIFKKKVISRNDPETPALDPERDFIDPEKNTGLPDDWGRTYKRTWIRNFQKNNIFHFLQNLFCLQTVSFRHIIKRFCHISGPKKLVLDLFHISSEREWEDIPYR